MNTQPAPASEPTSIIDTSKMSPEQRAALELTEAARAETRVALVVGNSDYQFAPKLKNPANDAADMSERLRSLGFEIIGGADLDRKSLVEALIKFGRAAETADVALFWKEPFGKSVVCCDRLSELLGPPKKLPRKRSAATGAHCALT